MKRPQQVDPRLFSHVLRLEKEGKGNTLLSGIMEYSGENLLNRLKQNYQGFNATVIGDSKATFQSPAKYICDLAQEPGVTYMEAAGKMCHD